jgi:uncharacterized protein HemY
MVQEHRSLRTLGTAVAATLVLAAMVLLGGCRTPPLTSTDGNSFPQPHAPPPVPLAPSVPPPTPPPPPPRENHFSPATRSLVTQARTLISHGDLDGASSTLDRALRIEPNNPLVWIELGRLRLAENDAHQAEGCGHKALALASGDRGTQAQAGRLLADALRAQGRNPEAIEIERQPYMR